MLTERKSWSCAITSKIRLHDGRPRRFCMNCAFLKRDVGVTARQEYRTLPSTRSDLFE
jgi:hypothetical protein